MSERKTYRVTAIPWGSGLELHVEGVGVTQSHGMEDAEAMVRDYISLVLDVTESSFDVNILEIA